MITSICESRLVYESVLYHHTLFERKTVVYSQKIQIAIKYIQRKRKTGAAKNKWREEKGLL